MSSAKLKEEVSSSSHSSISEYLQTMQLFARRVQILGSQYNLVDLYYGGGVWLAIAVDPNIVH